MKNVFFVIILTVLCTACGSSDRERAQGLVDHYERKIALQYGDRGFKQLGKVKLDTAEVKLVYRKEVLDLVKEMNTAAHENAVALSSLKAGVNNIVSYNILADELRSSGMRAQSLQNQINVMQRGYNPRVPGWMSPHRFRIIKRDGNMRLFEYIFYFNVSVTRITGIVCLSDSTPIYTPV